MENEELNTYKVYKYTNKVNDKVYIGQTRYSLKQRAGRDGNYYRRCTYFWRAIEKYGWENFEAEILEDNLTLNEANEKETFYIKQFDSMNKEKGYNLYEGGDNKHLPQEYIDKLIKRNTGRKISPETRKKLSESHKGQRNSPESIRKGVETRRKNYKRENNPNYGSKRPEHIKQKIKETVNKMFEDPEMHEKVSQGIRNYYKTHESKRKGTTLSKEAKERMSKANKGHKGYNNRKVICVETGEVFNSIKEAMDAKGIKVNHITFCCMHKPKYKTCKGFHWEYYEPKPECPKIQCVETGEIFNTQTEAMRAKGITNRHILDCCKGRRYKTCGGYHWKYYNPEEEN